MPENKYTTYPSEWKVVQHWKKECSGSGKAV